MASDSDVVSRIRGRERRQADKKRPIVDGPKVTAVTTLRDDCLLLGVDNNRRLCTFICMIATRRDAVK